MVLAALVRNELDYSVPKWYKARLTSIIEQWFVFRKQYDRPPNGSRRFSTLKPGILLSRNGRDMRPRHGPVIDYRPSIPI